MKLIIKNNENEFQENLSLVKVENEKFSEEIKILNKEISELKFLNEQAETEIGFIFFKLNKNFLQKKKK